MGGHKRKPKIIFKKKPKKTEAEADEIKRLVGQRESIDPSKIKSFKDFPLSRKTKDGLGDSGYTKPTEIQRESIGLALRGLDILGAAQTGSGKTLAFVTPILEILFTKQWGKEDGLGALIITPTRELAYQIFETVRKVGRRHEFSAGLIIGGKDLKFERKRMDQMNIIIGTPGRLLQHMDENPMFNCDNLQVLVLDEADRCLDMGFEQTMNGIIANLPRERQTLLFSATQTKSVKDLARLSLKSPVYVSVHENSKFSTPDSLTQSYMICPLESKLDMLWSFLKHHKKSKILVFLSSCKQVRYVHMLFCRMRPGISLLALYGSLHQLKRMSVYEEFCKKQAVVLFATDIAARGLDFPEVDWVVQLDCPEDATTYIHRVGRTARYNNDGEALLVLLPSEAPAMVAELENKKIPTEKIEANPAKIMSPRKKFEALLARDLTLKECAQRAFKSYLKSVFLMKNKEVFDVTQLELPTFARSLGLAVAPRVRFLQKKLGNKLKGADDDNDESESEAISIPKQKNSNTKSESTYNFNIEENESDNDDDLGDLLKTKKSVQLEETDDNPEEEINLDSKGLTKGKAKKPKTKASQAKKLLKKKIQVNSKISFDDEGQALTDVRRERQSDLAKEYEKQDASGIDIEKAKKIMILEDAYDKELFRERIRARHKEERLKAKLAKKGLTKDDPESQEALDNVDNEVVKLNSKKNNKTSKKSQKKDQVNDYEDEENSSSEEYEPDLNWLPDPDKVYGPKDLDDDDDDDFDPSEPRTKSTFKSKWNVVNESSSSSSEEEAHEKLEPSPKKRKLLSKLKSKKLEPQLMESLALQLLNQR